MMEFKAEAPRVAEEGLNYRRLTRRNTVFTLLMFVSPFILLLLFMNFTFSRLLREQVFNQLAMTVEENTKIISLFLQDREIDFRAYRQPDIDRLAEMEKMRSSLSFLVKDKPWYDLFFVADSQGSIVFSTDEQLLGKNIASRKYFQAALGGVFYNSGIFYSEFLQRPALVLAQPLVNRDGQVIGVQALSLNLNYFYNLIFDLRLGETSELFLVDSAGLLLSPTKLGGRPLVDYGFSQGDGNPHQGEKGVTIHVDYRGQKVLCAYEKIPATDIYLVSEVDLKEALGPVAKANRIIIAVFGVFFAILSGISRLHSQRTTGLFRRLTQGLTQALEDSRSKSKELDHLNVELANKIKETALLAEELRLSKEYILQLIDSLSPGVIGLDINGRITHFNRAFREMFDVSELKTGDDFFASLPWLSEREIEVAFENTIMSGQPQLIAKKILSRLPEEYFRFSFFPVWDAKKQIQGVSLLIENITEREKLQAQLAEYEKLSALSQLALGAAHEINNPLQGISSFLENLAEEAETEKEKKEISLVLENVARISETIRGLLNFARPSPPQFTKISLNQLTEETLSFLSHQPIFRNIRIEKALAPSLPQITADLNQIRQVLTNIFINAAQAMPQGGLLKVSTSKVKFKDYVQVEIADTGCGIPPENMKKIFDPFFTTKKNQGTGLGLSISLSYIKNHRGEINVQSEVGKGTTFTILLPIRQTGRGMIQEADIIS